MLRIFPKVKSMVSTGLDKLKAFRYELKYLFAVHVMVGKNGAEKVG